MTRLERQSFLGANSENILRGATVGIVGAGGGGSHMVQQFAHMGIGGYVIADPDFIEDTNTNRLIGGTLDDVLAARPKVDIAARLIRGLQPDARIVLVPGKWQDAVDDFKQCDVIVGAVDSFKDRDELERFARKHLIPYVDIGMDVHTIGAAGYLVTGQVILSMPGEPCLRCCGLITDERLAQEAQRYGAAGSRPQVVWSNGALASTAVSIVTQILTPWFKGPPVFVFLDYDGNKGSITPNKRMVMLKGCGCTHHPLDEAGDPLFDIRTQPFHPRPKASKVVGPAIMKPWWWRAWDWLWR
ncbi:ThiF family adenylyltransferase [Ancylobacter sonchi]|uniref:HesA/MoeB/ThiF family protein n=1 Tax=Ancylobacter sonchi TaxID=1937790 RepID=UPI001BD63DFD|nr:ThiF family adenylyltransferase [Ancylobacter sonchi]MBS7533290.1 ThiF family adenylyltransferase [Ancylobacter sonchi]